MDQKIRFCTTADGAKLAYAISGAGPPLVMSATWLTHLEHQWRSLAWRPWLEAFSREHTLVRYDQRGCGLSDRELGDVSFETWLSDFEGVVDAAGFERFSLLGTSSAGGRRTTLCYRCGPRCSNRAARWSTFVPGQSSSAQRPPPSRPLDCCASTRMST